MSAHSWALIAVMFACTYALRASSFLFKAKMVTSTVLKRLSALMPAGIMVILVVYSLSSVADKSAWAAAAGVAVTAGLHLWRKQALLSIVGGVATYGVVLALVT
ncbi:MAG: AzlD domain-containing protein [Actinomycetaceae bacterium]|nr:AzlD domain-containing protein [Actinomycetaceae bacterium]MDU0971162.1 AzlD domain-containing protein [Actinomycetaceae bacterium]